MESLAFECMICEFLCVAIGRFCVGGWVVVVVVVGGGGGGGGGARGTGGLCWSANISCQMDTQTQAEQCLCQTLSAACISEFSECISHH